MKVVWRLPNGAIEEIGTWNPPPKMTAGDSYGVYTLKPNPHLWLNPGEFFAVEVRTWVAPGQYKLEVVLLAEPNGPSPTALPGWQPLVPRFVPC